MKTEYNLRVSSLTRPDVRRSSPLRRNVKPTLTHKQGSQQPVSDRSLDDAAIFDRFIKWLGPDPDTAGQKYEFIRYRLIRMFSARRCVVAEELADATIERVTNKIAQLSTEFTGDPAFYFFGVARKIYLEYLRTVTVINRMSEIRLGQPSGSGGDELQHLYEQLDEALSTLSTSNRKLILGYYTGNGHEKIVQRRELAKQLCIRPDTLRLRVCRLRKGIKQHMLRSTNSLVVDAREQRLGHHNQ
jgi:hypothetical protein